MSQAFNEKIKIALCFYGQPRFINNPVASQSHYKNIINVENYIVDVFCHFWHDPNQELYIASDFSKDPKGRKEKFVPNAYKDAPERLEKLYSPKAMVYEKPMTFEVPNILPKVFEEYPAFNEVNFSNLKSHLYSWQKVLELFDQHNDGSYDFVIMTRYDTNIFSLPNLSNFIKGSNHSHATFDITVLDPSIVRKIKPFDRFDEILPDVKCFDSAEWKRKSIKSIGTDCKETHQWKFDLVRIE